MSRQVWAALGCHLAWPVASSVPLGHRVTDQVYKEGEMLTITFTITIMSMWSWSFMRVKLTMTTPLKIIFNSATGWKCSLFSSSLACSYLPSTPSVLFRWPAQADRIQNPTYNSLYPDLNLLHRVATSTGQLQRTIRMWKRPVLSSSTRTAARQVLKDKNKNSNKMWVQTHFILLFGNNKYPAT